MTDAYNKAHDDWVASCGNPLDMRESTRLLLRKIAAADHCIEHNLPPFEKQKGKKFGIELFTHEPKAAVQVAEVAPEPVARKARNGPRVRTVNKQRDANTNQLGLFSG